MIRTGRVQAIDSAVAGIGIGSGTQDALTQLYQATSIDNGYIVRHGPGPAVVADFQPPYFPPPYAVPQPPIGASSAMVEFPPGAAGPTPRHLTAMYGYTPGVQPAAAPPHPGLPSSSAVDPTDFGCMATSAGGGAVFGVPSPRRAAGGGGEFGMSCGTATTAGGLLQATSALPDFPNLDNLIFTQVCSTPL